MLFLSLVGFSQNNITSLTEYCNRGSVVGTGSTTDSSGTSNSTASNSTTTTSKISLLKSLLFDKQDAIYITSGITKEYGSNPISVYTNVSTLSRVNSENYNKEFIKIINIRVNSISELSNLNLSNLSTFPNLKFVVLTCAFPITQSNFSSVNIGNQAGIDFVFYYENPS